MDIKFILRALFCQTFTVQTPDVIKQRHLPDVKDLNRCHPRDAPFFNQVPIIPPKQRGRTLRQPPLSPSCACSHPPPGKRFRRNTVTLFSDLLHTLPLLCSRPGQLRTQQTDIFISEALQYKARAAKDAARLCFRRAALHIYTRGGPAEASAIEIADKRWLQRCGGCSVGWGACQR